MYLNYMIKLVLILSMIVSLVSCSEQRVEDKLSKINGWTLQITKGVTDTIGIKNWLPDPELSIEFTNLKGFNCLKPNLDFYPIELEEYIKEKLTKHLLLRASLYPPSPNLYRSKNYFILGWNLISYQNNNCCDCEKLESELIKKLELQPKLKPL